jgi:5-methylcytosine-specific restriction protein A
VIKITHHAKGPTRFYAERLGIKLKNPLWSWGAVDTNSRRVFLNIWDDHVNGDKVQVFWKDEDSHGSRERLKHLDTIQNGFIGIGILCHPKNTEARVRKIETFDDQQLFLLGDLSEDENFKYATIVRPFPISGLPTFVGLHNSTIDDLPVAPLGSKVPGRTLATGSRYQRDEKVRRFVIKQAKGVCEYCGELGFLLPDESHYLEAHHIIALANQGPDTVDNVIALCPSDHREAHYGKRAVAMENEMIEAIKKRQG